MDVKEDPMEVYRVGVAISMTSNASAVLGGLGSDLLGLGRQTSAVESDLRQVRTSARETTAAGSAALRGMTSLVNNARELNQQFALMRSAGLLHPCSPAANAAAEKVAMAAGNGRPLREPRPILVSETAAEVALPDSAQVAAVLSRFIRKPKALDLRETAIIPPARQISPIPFAEQRSMAWKSTNASGGRVDQKPLRNTMQTAGPTARTTEPAAFHKLMMTAMMKLGGHQAGRALAAAGHQPDAGVTTLRNPAEMTRPKRIDPGHLPFPIGEEILNGPRGLSARVQQMPGPRLESIPLPESKLHGLKDASRTKALKQAERAELRRSHRWRPAALRQASLTLDPP